jgi:hypothetical protein
VHRVVVSARDGALLRADERLRPPLQSAGLHEHDGHLHGDGLPGTYRVMVNGDYSNLPNDDYVIATRLVVP